MDPDPNLQHCILFLPYEGPNQRHWLIKVNRSFSAIMHLIKERCRYLFKQKIIVADPKRIRMNSESPGFPISGSGSCSESLLDRLGEEKNFYVQILLWPYVVGKLVHSIYETFQLSKLCQIRNDLFRIRFRNYSKFGS
jgi:hypothetical protein